MMLIVLDKDPIQAVDKLVSLTSKVFYFKQLIELGQLLCSAGMSTEYKTVSRGREIQNWIKRNPLWIYAYYNHLKRLCFETINIKDHTIESLQRINSSLVNILHESSDSIEDTTTAIFRYNKEYTSDIPTNTELPIESAVEMYYNYIQWKLKREKEKRECFAKNVLLKESLA